ncbi:MAG: hypothetical protein OQJ76_03565 [Rhodospirillales bacterium]|nr:hypothetical protein [Rhodospirillales bacterium]
MKAETMNPDETARLFARVFRGADGDAALECLRAITLDRVLGPAAADGELRHLEGQRALFVRIAAMVRRGRDGTPMPNPISETMQEEQT